MTCDQAFGVAEQAADVILSGARVDSIDMVFVLGSGWAHGADRMGQVIARFDLDTLPGFSRPVVEGHGGDALVTCLPSGRRALVLTGRTHLYEGRGAAPVVHGVRTAAAAGARIAVLTNGCGGLDPAWPSGTVVLIKDHINLTGDTPLVGPVFIDMSNAYDPALRDLARRIDPSLPEGVYAQFRGPSYETPAEVHMASVLGASLVGMSTALETIAAREAGMSVLGLSLVTNPAAGVSSQPLDHAEVLAAGEAASSRLATLLSDLAAKL